MKDSKKVRQVFIGHMTLDDVVLPDGTTKFNSPGGAALYAASGAFLWDDKVGLVARVGKDYNLSLLQQLEDTGLDLTGVGRVDLPSIHIWALYDRNGHRYFIPQKEAGQYVDLAPSPDEVPEIYLNEAKGFHIAPLPLPSHENIIQVLPDKRVISLDPHHEWVDPQYMDRWEKILKKVDIFLPSEDEFTELWNIDRVNEVKDYFPYLKKTSAMGPGIVALKIGPRGVIVYSSRDEKFRHIPTVAERVVDVTGAGDAFCGGFLNGYLTTKDPFTAALMGTVSSSVVLEDCGVLQALKFERSVVKQRLERLKSLTDPEKNMIKL